MKARTGDGTCDLILPPTPFQKKKNPTQTQKHPNRPVCPAWLCRLSPSGESPSAAVSHTSQFSLRTINQPRGPAPWGVARWSVMVLFLQTVEGHPRRTWQAIILPTPPSPLLLPTASGPVASSRLMPLPPTPLASFMNSPTASSSFISSALRSLVHAGVIK